MAATPLRWNERDRNFDCNLLTPLFVYDNAKVRTTREMQATDEQLALSTHGGHEKAFAELYERYYQRIYDFVARMVRDRDVADDLVQSTFVKAWENLREREVSGNIKAWLYTIARNNTINELKRRKWVIHSKEPNDEGGAPFPFTVVDSSRPSDPEGIVEDKELVDLVWRSATALNHKQFALLDLHLRKGLSVEELASAFGVRRNNMNTMLYRLRHSLEESVVATLLLRRGRQDCEELDALVAELPADAPDLAMRRATVKHLESCHRCQESRKRYTSPVEIFSGLALLPVFAELQAANWQAISNRVGTADAGKGGTGSLVQAAKQPLHWWARATTMFKAITLATLVTAVGVPTVLTLALAPGSGATHPPEPPATPVPAQGATAREPDPIPMLGVTVVSVRVESPESATLGEAVDVFASAGLLNHGPAETVLSDTTFSLTAPADCSASPDAPVTHQDTPLPRNVHVSITRGWEVICTGAGDHVFTVDVTAAIDASEPVADPHLMDNANSGTRTTEVLPR